MLLRHPGQADPSRALATDAQLLRTRTVSQTTVDRLGLGISAKEFISQYKVTALSDELLSLTVSGPTSNEAVERASALADAFLNFRRNEVKRDLQTAVDTLEERTGKLMRELETVNNQVNNFSSGLDRNSDAAVRGLGDLLTRRAAINDELGGLQARIEEITRDANSVVEKSRVVDPASEDDRSPAIALAANLAAGLVGGVSLGAGWIVVQEVAFDRVRRRQDFVTALGAPVSVSIGPLRGPLWVQRRRFDQQQVERARDVEKMVSHLRASLSQGGTLQRALVVVSVDSDGPAALAVALMAVDLTREGRSVLVADLSSNSPLAGLFRVPAKKTSTLDHKNSSSLTLAFPLANADPDDTVEECGHQYESEPRNEHDVVLALAQVNPAVGASHLTEWATTAVTVVTSGRSTAIALRSTSQMLRVAGIELTSTVLVGADPQDESLGLANRHSLHLPEVPLPTTGTRNTSGSTDDSGRLNYGETVDAAEPTSAPHPPEAQAATTDAESASDEITLPIDPEGDDTQQSSPPVAERSPSPATENTAGANGNQGEPEDAVGTTTPTNSSSEGLLGKPPLASTEDADSSYGNRPPNKGRAAIKKRNRGKSQQKRRSKKGR